MFNNSFKMTKEPWSSCKKYIVERVISPSVFCVSEYERGKDYKKKVKRFECLMAKDVEKYPDPRKIVAGETVAVKHTQGFRRGVVTDIFNRSFKFTYWVSLIDSGSVIETDQSNLYAIKNNDLRNKNLDTFEVSIHGIQPAALKLEGDNTFLGGILQKRVSDSWSPKAFQFVRDIMSKNPCIFVKIISSNKNTRTISGEIYFIEESSNMAVSLREKLCVKGFAVSCDASSKLSQDSLQGETDSVIEEKIPNKALSGGIQRSEVLKSLESPKKERRKIKNLGDLSDVGIFARQQKLESESSLETSVQNQSFEPCSSELLSLSSVEYSSSWILKKCQNNSAPSSGTYKKDDMCNSEQGDCNCLENFNESAFRVVLRSMELFNEKKQFENFYCK